MIIDQNKIKDPIPFLEYGIYLQRSGKIESSIGILKRAIQYGTSESEPYFELGRSFYRLKDYSESRSVLEKALELSPSDHRIHYLLARVCYEDRDSKCGDRHSGLAKTLSQNSEMPE